MKRFSHLVFSFVTLAGCAKSVPSPWKESGVPAEHLVEVHGGTSNERFSGVYDQDPRGVADAFAAGLTQGGFQLCGHWIQDSENKKVTEYFRKDGEVWELKSIASGEHRTPTTFEKTKKTVDGKYAPLTQAEFSEAGCVP